MVAESYIIEREVSPTLKTHALWMFRYPRQMCLFEDAMMVIYDDDDDKQLRLCSISDP
jgi:hypothetical protein